jgi:hypothetical protein
MTSGQWVGVFLVLCILGFALYQFAFAGGKKENGRSGMSLW